MLKISFIFRSANKLVLILSLMLSACVQERGIDFSVVLENKLDSSIFLCESEKAESCEEIKKGGNTFYEFHSPKEKMNWVEQLSKKSIKLCDRKVLMPEIVSVAAPVAFDSGYRIVIDKSANEKLCHAR